MVNGKTTSRSAAMTATLEFLSQMADAIFETQMRRAALRISARQILPH
jgi:hypothetical protein